MVEYNAPPTIPPPNHNQVLGEGRTCLGWGATCLAVTEVYRATIFRMKSPSAVYDNIVSNHTSSVQKARIGLLALGYGSGDYFFHIKGGRV